MPWLRKAASRRRPAPAQVVGGEPVQAGQQRRVVGPHLAVGIEDLVEEPVAGVAVEQAGRPSVLLPTDPSYRPVR